MASGGGSRPVRLVRGRHTGTRLTRRPERHLSFSLVAGSSPASSTQGLQPRASLLRQESELAGVGRCVPEARRARLAAVDSTPRPQKDHGRLIRVGHGRGGADVVERQHAAEVAKGIAQEQPGHHCRGAAERRSKHERPPAPRSLRKDRSRESGGASDGRCEVELCIAERLPSGLAGVADAAREAERGPRHRIGEGHYHGQRRRHGERGTVSRRADLLVMHAVDSSRRR
jgi:hypothetical protein